MNAERCTIGDTMDIACRAGKIMLENGGEIYRVEDTMLYICRAFGMEECECYATPTSIMISIIDTKGEVHTRMLRISSRGINLSKLEAVNNFSRQIFENPVTVPQAKKMLLDINTSPAYNYWLTILAAAMGTSSFTIVFGGGFTHFLCGIFMGAVLRMVVTKLEQVRLGYFTTHLIGGAVAALGGWLFAYLGILPEWWIITFATLMLMVPGLLITNALRDTVAGDLISGLSRGVEAFSVAAALAFGAAATFMILTRLGGG